MVPRTFVLLAGLVIAAMIAIPGVLATSEQDPGGKSEVKQLADRIEKLERRVAELEKKERVVVVPQQRVPAFAPGRVPEGWSEREINGMKFYIVPLDSTRPK